MRTRERLVAWREAEGLNQSQAADRIGIGQASLSRIETGAKRPGLRAGLLIDRATAGTPHHIPVADWAETESQRRNRLRARRPKSNAA